MRVINFFGSPGAGKSMFAAAVYVELKRRGKSVELVREYLQDLIYDGATQHYSRVQRLHHQHHRQERLRGVRDYAVTDCPLLQMGYYAFLDTGSPAAMYASRDQFTKFENFNIFVKFDAINFTEVGRVHTLAEAHKIDASLREYVDQYIDVTIGNQPVSPIDDHVSFYELVMSLCDRVTAWGSSLP